MKRKALGVLVAFAATAPAVVAPKLVAPAQAQPANAEYPDVPRGHWAYEAINKLSQAGILEGRPDGNYYGAQPMTRYEFAVAIARLLGKIPPPQVIPPATNNTPGRNGDPGQKGDRGEQGPKGDVGPPGPQLPDLVFKRDIANFITRQEVNDLIAALRKEFADELARLGVRVGALEGRVTALENKKVAPPRMTTSFGLRASTGVFGAIDNGTAGAFPGGPGRVIVNGGNAPGGLGFVALPGRSIADRQTRVGDTKFGYTDFELRLTDRISDRLSASAALRSLGNTQEDQWAGDSEGGAYLREAYAVADMTDKKAFLVKNLSAVIGRQRTKIAQGLLYDNDLSPTDQAHLMGNIGPIKLSGFTGSNDGASTLGVGDQNTGTGRPNLGNPYLDSGAVKYLGSNIVGGGGAIVGFAGTADLPAGGAFLEGNEALIRASASLFRIGGRPVELGISKLLAGVQNQEGYSYDLSLPLFKRTIGVEYVNQQRGFNGVRTPGTPHAYNITVPVLRTKLVDLNAAYGAAEDGFEYFVASSANPYARTYAEAVFDRPLALGAPMVNGNVGGGGANYMAAKRAFDVSGTVRVPISFLRRTPIDFRWYNAHGTGGINLGSVWSVGSTFNVTPGLDLELKYGRYQISGPTPSVNYFRLGANIGF
jgi:hypothetical protein